MPFRYDAAADTWRGLDEFGTPVVAGESLEGCAAALAAYQRGEPIAEDEDDCSCAAAVRVRLAGVLPARIGDGLYLSAAALREMRGFLALIRARVEEIGGDPVLTGDAIGTVDHTRAWLEVPCGR